MTTASAEGKKNRFKKSEKKLTASSIISNRPQYALAPRVTKFSGGLCYQHARQREEVVYVQNRQRIELAQLLCTPEVSYASRRAYLLTFGRTINAIIGKETKSQCWLAASALSLMQATFTHQDGPVDLDEMAQAP